MGQQASCLQGLDRLVFLIVCAVSASACIVKILQVCPSSRCEPWEIFRNNRWGVSSRPQDVVMVFTFGALLAPFVTLCSGVSVYANGGTGNVHVYIACSRMIPLSGIS